MPNETDERIAREQAQNHPPSWASLFDHADPPLFEDAGPSYFPDDRSSASKMAKRRQARDQAAAERRDLAVIAQAAAEQNDDAALEKATDLIRHGQKVPPGLRILAARAAQRQGGAMPSSADQHAARALRGRN
jgi:hypothetical protein